MRFVKKCVALTALLAVAAMPAALAAERADVAVHAGGVDLLPNVGYRSAKLTVSGNGITFSRVIGRGRSLSISPFDLEGQLLPDGVYSWQLELLPNDATAKRLRAAAAENGGKAPEAWSAQSGTFAISGGSIASPDLSEGAPARANRGSFDGGALISSFGGPANFSGSTSRDNDAAVGNRKDAEARARAAAAAAAPAALPPGFEAADRQGFEREDATALALGASPEAALRAKTPEQPTQLSRGAAARSDNGTNGRPRSKQD